MISWRLSLVVLAGWFLASPALGQPQVLADEAPQPPAATSDPAAQDAADEPAAEPAAEPDVPPGPTPDQTTDPTPGPDSESGEQIFSDPELEDWPSPVATPEGPLPDASAPTITSADAQVRAFVHTRFGADLQREDPREEVLHGTTLAALEATLRRSESLRFALGLRARHRFATLAGDVPDSRSMRTELDVVPTAGYADATLAPGMHLQIGYQGTQLGRFDVFSATNILAVSDLRDGAATLPEGNSVAQLAVLFDYDMNSWLSLRAIYVPFFTPHLVAVTEGDYAIFPTSQAAVDAGIAAVAGSSMESVDLVQTRIRRLLYNNLSRGDRERIASTGVSVFAPEADLSQPQAALRLSARGPDGEIAVTAGTAREHLPTLDPGAALLDVLAEGLTKDGVSTMAEGYLAADPRPVKLRYDRFAVFSADAAADVGPLSLGVELAYMMNRTFYAVRDGASNVAEGMPDTSGFPRAGHTDMVHVGGRVEYVQNTRWLLSLESFVAVALHEPAQRYAGDDRSNPVTRTWLFLEDGRFLWGAAALAQFSPDELGLGFELGAGVFSGPSFALMPRITYALLDNLEAELGAVFVEGASGGNTVALGSIYDSIDQVHVGLRYLP